MCPKDGLEGCISNNTLCPEFGQVIDINSSSWKHLHPLGINYSLYILLKYNNLNQPNSLVWTSLLMNSWSRSIIFGLGDNLHFFFVHCCAYWWSDYHKIISSQDKYRFGLGAINRLLFCNGCSTLMFKLFALCRDREWNFVNCRDKGRTTAWTVFFSIYGPIKHINTQLRSASCMIYMIYT